jgi:hypothetical protein
MIYPALKGVRFNRTSASMVPKGNIMFNKKHISHKLLRVRHLRALISGIEEPDPA